MNSGLSHNTVNAIVQDRQGFMWIGSSNGLNRFDGVSFKTYVASDKRGQLGNDFITSLYAEMGGAIWIGTEAGVYRYDPRRDTFTLFDTKGPDDKPIWSQVIGFYAHRNRLYISTLSQGVYCWDGRRLTHVDGLDLGTAVVAMTFGTDGRVWLGTYGGGLVSADSRLQHATTWQTKGASLSDCSVYALQQEGRNLYVGTDRYGLLHIDTSTGVATPLLDAVDGKPIYVHDMLRRGHELWIATEQGLYIYDTATGGYAHYFYEPLNPFSLSDNALQCVVADRDGGLWTGSWFGGVNYSPASASTFNTHLPRADAPDALHGRHVRAISEDRLGYIWIGTEDSGLNCFDPRTGRFSYIEESRLWPNIHCLEVDGDRLWVGTFSYGLKCVDIRTHHVVRSFRANRMGGSLDDDAILALHKGSDGRLYIGSMSGLSIYDGHAFHHVEGGPSLMVNDITEDHARNLWVATQDNGLYMRQRNTGKWFVYHPFRGHRKTNKVLSVNADSGGRVWITTQNLGVFRFNAERNYFEAVNIPQEDPVMFVLDMVQDRDGKLWFTTNNGLLCHDPLSGVTTTYNTQNGLISNQFNYNSCAIAHDSIIYMGGINGFVSFNPRFIRHPVADLKIVATDLLVNNRLVEVSDKDSPLKENITMARALSLAHDQNSISLRVAVLKYNTSWHQQVEYRLEGIDQEWKHLLVGNYITYTNLPSGRYTLQVRVNQHDGSRPDDNYQLTITVRPPLWLTWWAKALYTLAGILAVVMGWRAMNRRVREKRVMAMRRLEHEKEQELYESKINFFISIAHEIRTPLTLIKAPLDHIIDKFHHGPDEQENLVIMRQNVERLLNLVRQLLDFRKMERGGLKLNFERVNVSRLVSDVNRRFLPAMQQRGIGETLQLPQEPVYAWIDSEATTKIVSNLCNNAVKYSGGHIDIQLTTDADNLRLTVSNDGKVISRQARQQLFKPFYRAQETARGIEGTGIGLALARSLAVEHGGYLTVEDNDSLNVFVLTLPLRRNMPTGAKPENIEADSLEKLREGLTYESSRRTVLVVEDNMQMLHFECAALQGRYNVVAATDGQSALDELDTHSVDAIVSDVMMEPMDGFEFCAKLKSDINTSHIPIVLLTALTIDSAKVKGMESGADAYIEKPFSMDYLVSTIDNLIRNRDNVRRAFAASPFVSVDTVAPGKVDRDFMQRLDTVLHEHLSDSEYGVVELASDMMMSRTSLNRKLREIVDMTPNNYIKLFRLREAARLLKNDGARIGEVAYQVGFTSPSYFTQCFYKQFGLLPKAFLSGDAKQ